MSKCTDGIPGGFCETLWGRLAPSIHEIANQINEGGEIISDTWENGEITHIDKKIARLNVTTIDQYD